MRRQPQNQNQTCVDQMDLLSLCSVIFLNLFCSPHQLIWGCFSSVYVAWLLFLELLVSSNLLLVLPD